MTPLPTPPDRVRVIARLDIKGPNLIKGVHLEGLRIVGDPQQYATRYYESGIDELLYLDAVASLYQRNSLGAFVAHAAEHLFVPLTVGGGVRSVEDAAALLRVGADKVAVNTAAHRDPELIDALAKRFGSQCVVAQIDAKVRPDGGWEAYTDGGREHSGRDVMEWAAELVARGAGEILLTSIDREGTRRGFDTALVASIATSQPVPVIASGGFGSPAHATAVVADGGADAVAIADGFHRERTTPEAVREAITGMVRG
jgi:imidazole glycerol-phosphate synthase subunit HisF